MTTEVYRRVQGLAGLPNLSVHQSGKAIEAVVSRGDVCVRVLVPETVLEWFVEVEHPQTASVLKDWCDYEGYEEESFSALEKSMATEVAEFIRHLLDRDLRYVSGNGSKSKGRLEWLVENHWESAVPFESGAT